MGDHTTIGQPVSRFDLFGHPFRLLGIDPPVPSVAILAAHILAPKTQSASADALAEARAALLEPAGRLSCELAYPIDSSPAQIEGIFAALSSNKPEPELLLDAASLAPLSKANFIAHLATRLAPCSWCSQTPRLRSMSPRSTRACQHCGKTRTFTSHRACASHRNQTRDLTLLMNVAGEREFKQIPLNQLSPGIILPASEAEIRSVTMKSLLGAVILLALTGAGVAEAGIKQMTRVADAATDACMSSCEDQNASCKRVCPTTLSTPCLISCDSQAQTCRASCQRR
jgi:hypothetical protein